MIDVVLSEREMAIADFVADRRQRDGEAAEADPHKYGFEGSNLELHREGCYFEMAFAKGANLYWSGAGSHYYEDDDVAQIQVKGTTHPLGRLLARPGQLNEESRRARWVLIRGVRPEFTLIGWLYGWECERDEWLEAPNDRPPAYFAPTYMLRHIQSPWGRFG